MRFRLVLIVTMILTPIMLSEAQVRPENRFEILRTLIADSAASRAVMPLGGNGIELFDDGQIDEEKLQEELRKEGRSISEGQVVSITGISFGNDKIEIELDGGGENKKSFLDRLEVGMGGSTRPVGDRNEEEAKGSKIVLRFRDQVPSDLTVDQLKAYLSPVLDFNKQNFMDSGIESLPDEFQEAVRAKEAKIGMKQSTVLMALGRPDKKVWETVDGVEREDWIYFKTGLGADFVTFEDGVVVKIVSY